MNHRFLPPPSFLFGLQQRVTKNAKMIIGNRYYSSKNKQLSLRLYRVLQHTIRDDIHNDDTMMLFLQSPLDPRQLGQAQILPISSSNNNDETTTTENERYDAILQFFETQSSRDHKEEDNYKYLKSNNEKDSSSSIWVTATLLKDTIRHAFQDHHNNNVQQHQKAIDALRIWKEQIYIWNQCTTVTTNEHYGIRVIATSRYVGTSSNPNKKLKDNQNYHFAYKIRIQSLRYPIPNDETRVVQLLGRTWYIEEEEETEPFLSTNNNNDDDDDDTMKLYKDVVSIDAPTTGAVGHLPVIRPGESFEYISKCELGTKKGSMRGCFHMALVPTTTQSAQVGDPIDVLLHKEEEEENDEIFFKVPVGPFTLTST